MEKYSVQLRGELPFFGELIVEAESEETAGAVALDLVGEGNVAWKDDTGAPYTGPLMHVEVWGAVPLQNKRIAMPQGTTEQIEEVPAWAGTASAGIS